MELLATRPPGEVPPFLRAQLKRAKALAAGAQGEDDAVEEGLVLVETTFSDLDYPIWLARTQLERAEWLAGKGRLDRSGNLARQAAASFETMGLPSSR